MNQLFNIIYLLFSLYYLMPIIETMSKGNMIYLKLYIVATTITLQSLFHVISRYINKKGIKLNEILDIGIFRGLLVLFGYMLYQDIGRSPNVMNKIPGLINVIEENWTQIIFMITPVIILAGTKCFFEPY